MRDHFSCIYESHEIMTAVTYSMQEVAEDIAQKAETEEASDIFTKVFNFFFHFQFNLSKCII